MNKVDILVKVGQAKVDAINKLTDKVGKLENKSKADDGIMASTQANIEEMAQRMDVLLSRICMIEDNQRVTNDDMASKLEEVEHSNKTNRSGQAKINKNHHSDAKNSGDHQPTGEKHLSPDAVPGQIKWIEVSLSNISQLSTSVHEKIETGKKSLRTEGFAGVTKPRVAALYVKGITRGPIGALCRCLQKSLPKWVVLSLRFIGKSTT